MRVGIVAGEASGDQLAAGLMQALKAREPSLQVEAVAGPRMREVGCVQLADASELAVMGLTEVLPEVARLWKLRRRLVEHWKNQPPDVFIGVDAPDFNLGLEKALRQSGVPTVHYVSPTVWAWRAGRVHRIAASADAVLCLFPFEPDCYAGVAIDARYVGHPFAAAMQALPSQSECRRALGFGEEQPLLALVPGSRGGEVGQVAPVMLEAAARLQHEQPRLQLAIPAANAERKTQLRALLAGHEGLRISILDGEMRRLLRASDAAMVTSGTATLETLLANTPMAVVYRASAVTNFVMRDLGLLKTPFVSLPNVLAGRNVVPEFLQGAAEPASLVRAMRMLLSNAGAREAQLTTFAEIQASLLRNTDEEAAKTVSELAA